MVLKLIVLTVVISSSKVTIVGVISTFIVSKFMFNMLACERQDAYYALLYHLFIVPSEGR